MANVMIVFAVIVTIVGISFIIEGVLERCMPTFAVGTLILALGTVTLGGWLAINRAQSKIDTYEAKINTYEAAASQQLIAESVDGDRVNISGKSGCTIQAKNLDGKIIFEGVNLSEGDAQPLTPKKVAALCKSTALATD